MNNYTSLAEPRSELSSTYVHYQDRNNTKDQHDGYQYYMHQDEKNTDESDPNLEINKLSSNKQSNQPNVDSRRNQPLPHESLGHPNTHQQNREMGETTPIAHGYHHNQQQDDISRELSIQGLSLVSGSPDHDQTGHNDGLMTSSTRHTPRHDYIPQSDPNRHRSGSQQIVSNQHSSHGAPQHLHPGRYSNNFAPQRPRQDSTQPLSSQRHSDPNVISRDVNEFGLERPAYFPVDSRDTETSRHGSAHRPPSNGSRSSADYQQHNIGNTSNHRMSNTPIQAGSAVAIPPPHSGDGRHQQQLHPQQQQHHRANSAVQNMINNDTNQMVSRNPSGEYDQDQTIVQRSYPNETQGRRRPPRQRFERGRVHAFRVHGSRFVIDARYMPIRPLGRGAYGIVCSAKDLDYDIKVAIKRIPSAFRDIVDARRILRETQLLRSFHHPHIIGLCDVIDPGQEPLNDVYMVMELMETDLHKIIYSSNQLTDEHIQYLIYQTLRGLHYIHSHGVIHRDLKPSNLLLNQDCSLKICDFGLARIIGEQFDNNELTEYVVTRWYRAPEVMYSLQDYDYAIDVWAVGCIFAELLNRQPLFPGDDYIHQLHLMFSVLGTPRPDDLSAITNTRALSYIQSLPHQDPVDFARHFPTASPLALELLQSMLTLHPKRRINVADALNHPFFQTIHEQYPPLEETNDIISLRAIDQCTSTEELRQLMLEMVKFYRPWYNPPDHH